MIYYPNTYKFSKDHEWIHNDGSIAFIGLTEMAKRELGEISKIEITGLYKQLKKDQVFWRIISERYLTKLLMPVSGSLLEINSKYLDDPKAINEKFCHDNWLIKIQIDSEQKLDHLLNLDEYKAHKSDSYFHMLKYLMSTKHF